VHAHTDTDNLKTQSLRQLIAGECVMTDDTSQFLFFVRQQEQDRDGHAHVPGAVRVRIVGLSLGKRKDAHSDDGQNDAWSEPEHTTSRWITVLRATTHSHLNRHVTHHRSLLGKFKFIEQPVTVRSYWMRKVGSYSYLKRHIKTHYNG